MTTNDGSTQKQPQAPTPRIAIIGGGAAGLACARAFGRREDVASSSWSTTVLEMDEGIGGVWNYREQDTKRRPMYRGLRTNLPKEIMAYREFPWPEPPAPDDCNNDSSSFLTHRQVQSYLQQYAEKFDIPVCFECEVTQLTLLDGSQNPSCLSPSPKEIWPQIELTIVERTMTTTTTTKETKRKEVFDAVMVANGHYSSPRIPHIPGMREHFADHPQRRMFHSMEYDNPTEFRDQTVLCIGGRASGSDIAREIARAGGAKKVYLSDSSRTTGEPRTLDQITWVPRTIQVLPSNGAIEFDHNCPIQPNDVDTVILCTGYDYSFPFINANSGLELDCTDRCVRPLYEQLWHARYPHIAFIGLPHSILPFPLFEFQAEACRTVWKKKTLPTLAQRLQVAAAATGGEGKDDGRVEDTHYLGPAQWDYCRRMARYAEIYDETIESYLRVNKEIWDLSSFERKGEFPGGPDDYRQSVFYRDHEKHNCKLVSSLIQPQQTEG
ncbi:hypothetical protein ACA910_004173 [Epithemia clementina (nom. ined.)]